MAKKTKQPTKLPLEKILTISATEYLSMSRKRFSDYDPVGVHCDVMNYWANPTESFADLVPSEAEVVVGYTVHRSLGEYEEAKPDYGARGVQFTAHGTALVPKRQFPKKR